MSRQPWLAWSHLRPGLCDLIEHRNIDLGVDLCGPNGSMPQSRSDVLQRSALPQKRLATEWRRRCAAPRPGGVTPARRIARSTMTETAAWEAKGRKGARQPTNMRTLSVFGRPACRYS